MITRTNLEKFKSNALLLLAFEVSGKVLCRRMVWSSGSIHRISELLMWYCTPKFDQLYRWPGSLDLCVLHLAVILIQAQFFLEKAGYHTRRILSFLLSQDVFSTRHYQIQLHATRNTDRRPRNYLFLYFSGKSHMRSLKNAFLSTKLSYAAVDLSTSSIFFSRPSNAYSKSFFFISIRPS